MIDANGQTQKQSVKPVLFFCVWFLFGCHNHQARQASLRGEGVQDSFPTSSREVKHSDRQDLKPGVVPRFRGDDNAFGDEGVSGGDGAFGDDRVIGDGSVVRKSPPRLPGSRDVSFDKTGKVDSVLSRDEGAFVAKGKRKESPCPECVSDFPSSVVRGVMSEEVHSPANVRVWPSVKQLCPECLKSLKEKRFHIPDLQIRTGEQDNPVLFNDFPSPNNQILRRPLEGRGRSVPPPASLVERAGGFSSFHCLVRIQSPRGNDIRSIEFQPYRPRYRAIFSSILDLNPSFRVEFFVANGAFGFGFPREGEKEPLLGGQYPIFSDGRFVGHKIPFSEITKGEQDFVYEISYGDIHLQAECVPQQLAYQLPQSLLVYESSSEEEKKTQCIRTRTRNPMVRREQIFYYENDLGHFPEDFNFPLRMHYSRPVDEYMGVVAYGNQKKDGGLGDYHCTELVHRFFKKVYQVPTKWGMGLGHGRALAYNLVGFANRHSSVVWDPRRETEAKLRFAFFDNGCSPHLPLPGSAVSFEWKPYGHVAIVRKVQFLAEDVAYVYWFQQSTYKKMIGPQSVKTLFVKNEKGFWSASRVKGWITPLRLSVVPPADLILVEESGHDGDQNS